MATEGPVSSFPMDREAAEEEIACLVRKPGFDELTVGDITRHMNNRFNTNFDSYKSQLKKMVIEEIKKRDQEKEDSSDEDESGSGSDSDDDDDNGSEEKKEEPAKVQKEVEKPKPSKPAKQEESDSDSGVEDAVETKKAKKVSSKVPAKVQPDMASNIKSTRRAAASDALKQIRFSSGAGRFNNKKKEKDPNADMSGKFGPMTKLCYISTELQQVTKDQWMKRCDVVKVLWDYIKENNLKDPKNGQFVICDDVLKSIFNKNRLKAFGMTKFLTKHIIGTSDMEYDMRQEAEAEMDKRRSEWKERERKRKEEELVRDDSEGPSMKKPKVEEDKDDDKDDDDSDADSTEEQNKRNGRSSSPESD